MDILKGLFEALIKRFQSKSASKFLLLVGFSFAVYFGLGYFLDTPNPDGTCCLLPEKTINLFVFELPVFETIRSLSVIVLTLAGVQLPEKKQADNA